MRFSKDVVTFDVPPFTLIGNLSNGYVIGLNPEATGICLRMVDEDVPEAEIAAVDQNLLDHLRMGGFAFGSEKPALSRSVYLHVTHRCNLDCVGCYSAANNKSIAKDMSLQEITSVLDGLVEAHVGRLVISGGEPFLRDDLIEILRYAKERCGITHVDVLTNGMRLRDCDLRALRPFVDRVCVSFDGSSAKAKSYVRGGQRFDILVDAVERIKNAGIKAHIVPTIHAKNICEMEAYSQLANDLGVTMNYSLLSAPRNNEAISELLPSDSELARMAREMLIAGIAVAERSIEEPHQLGISVCNTCGAGGKSLSIAANGDVFPCHMLHCDRFKMGNLLEESLDAILARRSFCPAEVDSIPDCVECDIRYLCGGGCRARAVYATGDSGDKDPYCALMKTYYHDLFSNIAKR